MSVHEVGKSLGKRISKDVAQHHKKVREYIKKGIADVIGNEDIVTGDRKRKIRVRIRSLKDFYFRYKRVDYGLGSGKGKGKAGNEDGDTSFDSEFELEELIDMALEDCGLPNLKKKDAQEFEILTGYKIKGIDKTGIRPLLDKRRTAKAAIKRIADFIIFLMQNTGCTKLQAQIALEMCKGDIRQAYQLLLKVKNGEAALDLALTRKFFMSQDDYRFLELEDDTEKISNAVIFFLGDWSGSMGGEKKYLMRMVCFWLSEAVKRLYRNVKIVFIGYENNAEVATEEEFFSRAESGGTRAFAAYELVIKKIKEEFPPSRWNSYVFQFSDGEDFSVTEAGKKLEELFKTDINLFCYGEITDSHATGGSVTLINEYRDRFKLTRVSDAGIDISVYESERLPFVAAMFSDRKHLHQVVKQFLKKDRSKSL